MEVSMKNSGYILPKLLWGIVFVNLLLWSIVLYPASTSLLVYFFDVGQGDAILVFTPAQQTILIDGGPDARVVGHLGTVMPFFNKKIDAVVLTHPHEDHQAGLYHVLQAYTVPLVIERMSWQSSFLEPWKELTKNSIVVDPQTIDEIYTGDTSIGIRFLPETIIGDRSGNNSSIVTSLRYGETEFLFMGDLEKEGEENLLQNNLVSRTDVLKVGHHGSATSSTTEFLNVIQPHYAVVSVGVNNRYHHPASTTIERLLTLGSIPYRTDEQGTIVMESDGKTITVQKY